MFRPRSAIFFYFVIIAGYLTVKMNSTATATEDPSLLQYGINPQDLVYSLITYITECIAHWILETGKIVEFLPKEDSDVRVSETHDHFIMSNIELRTKMTLLLEYRVAVYYFLDSAGIRRLPFNLPDKDRYKYVDAEILPESVALLNMAVDLRTMLPINRILLSAIEDSVKDLLNTSHLIDLGDVLSENLTVSEYMEYFDNMSFPIWLGEVIESVESYPYLNDQFESKKIEARNYINANPKPIILENREHGEVDEDWEKSHAPIRRIFLKTRSLLECFANSFQDDEGAPSYWLIRSMVEVAQETTENADQLNGILHETLLDTEHRSIYDSGKCSYRLVASLQLAIKHTDFRLAERVKKVQMKITQHGLYKVLRNRQPLIMAQKTNTFSWTLASSTAAY